MSELDVHGACAGCAARTAGHDSAMPRRAFLSQAAFAAAALALAACADGEGGSITAPTTASGSLRLTDYPPLATVGGVALVSLSGSPAAIVRTGERTFVALSRICPHQGGTVNATASGFTCPNHGARFSSTGQWVGGQNTSNLRSYPATYDATAGTITIG